MSRRFLATLLAVGLAASTAACATSRVNTRYNRFTDETIVTHRGLDLVPPDPWAGTSLKMQVEYSSQGLIAVRPEQVTIAVVSAAKGSPYKDDHRLQLIADGNLLESREAGYDPSERAGVVVEYMWVKLPTPVFVALANAADVRGQIGPTAFVLTPEQVAELKDYAAKLPPEGRKAVLELPFKLPDFKL
jgi:hypothetical protein